MAPREDNNPNPRRVPEEPGNSGGGAPDVGRAEPETDHEKQAPSPLTAIAPQDMTDAGVAEHIEEMPAPDGAAVLEHLPRELSADVAEYLDPETAANILCEMDATLAASVIIDMEVPEAALVLEYMDPDDRVDILAHVPNPRHDQLVNEMASIEAAEVRSLEQFPPDTAGGIMTTDTTALSENLTVEAAIAELRRLSEELEQMYYVYVVDQRGHLVGVLSMRDLILAKPDRKLGQIMHAEVRSVPATMDQEEVANLFDKYGYLAMPVVDGRNRLIGIVTVDDVVDVMREEATEDVQKMFGAGAEERLSSTWGFSFRMRVIWLVVNLGTAFLAGSVVGAFQGTLAQLTLLAIYMPIVAGMGGNAGAQAMAVVVRGMAVGKVDRAVLWHVIRRELRVGFMNGLVIGAITALIAYLWHGNAALGIVVALALLLNLTLACLSGASVPFVMKKLGFDPAQSATIFATAITDIGGFFGLFMLARLFMKWLHP